MIQPIVHDLLTQVMHRHYGLGPVPAAEAALKLLDILEQYDLQLIIGEWTRSEVRTLSPFEMLQKTAQETMEREPWLAREIQ